MACTQPAALTLLRVKRARAHAALDAVHIRLPKRARTESPDTRRFRRIPATADVGTLGPARVVDIDPALLRKPSAAPCGPPTEEPPPAGKPALSGRELPDSEILYNGVPLQREFVDDEFMFDIFAEDRPENGDLVLDGGNVAWVAGEDLPVFDWDSESDEECDESDEERSVDYPSTPEQSVDSDAFEDDWRARERRFCESDGNETEDGVENLYDIRAGDSDDGDCFDYDA